MKQRLAQLLSTIRCPTSFAGRVVDAYDRWAGDDDAITEEHARELLAERIVFADQPKTMMLLLFIALESKDHGVWSHLEYFQYFQGIEPHSLREDTSLQRAMKQFVLDGGKPGVGLGYLKKEYRTGTCLAL